MTHENLFSHACVVAAVISQETYKFITNMQMTRVVLDLQVQETQFLFIPVSLRPCLATLWTHLATLACFTKHCDTDHFSTFSPLYSYSYILIY